MNLTDRDGRWILSADPGPVHAYPGASRERPRPARLTARPAPGPDQPGVWLFCIVYRYRWPVVAPGKYRPGSLAGDLVAASAVAGAFIPAPMQINPAAAAVALPSSVASCR